MIKTLTTFNGLTTAEQYFEFFALPYDPAIVNVNRLHILQKFSQSMRAINQTPDLTEAETLQQYRDALQNAYEVFLTSSGVEQKLFKVFQQPPSNVVKVSDIAVEE